MNHLNSVLLEGIVREIRDIKLDDESRRLTDIIIESDRYYIDQGGRRNVESFEIPVQCWGSLGDKAKEHIKIGMTIRVVGRLRKWKLASADGGEVTSTEIVAEHIEYRTKKDGDAVTGVFDSERCD